MKKILVIDDEKEIRELLKEYLELEGYLVYTAKNGEEAFTKIAEDTALILLDVNMPGMDGYQVCKRIRDAVGCPILFLTARTEEADRVSGFQAGGDDYVLKPFSMEELLARVEAHLRREERKREGHSVYMDKNLTVDFTGRMVQIGGCDIMLTKTEFDIVELLLTHAGCVFDKERIYESVRGYDKEGDASIITEHIRRIRGKLKAGGGKDYIETVWGVGYKWTC